MNTHDHHEETSPAVAETPVVSISCAVTSRYYDLPIEDVFYIEPTKDCYAVLERVDATRWLRLRNRIELPGRAKGLVDRIDLCDFPVGQWTLSIAGMNCATAKYVGGRYVFDLTKEGSSTLQALKEKTGSDGVGINMGGIEHVCLNYPKFVELSERLPYEVRLYGRFDGNGTRTCLSYLVYPRSTYELSLLHPTESIVVILERVGQEWDQDKMNPEEIQDSFLLFRLDGADVARADLPMIMPQTHADSGAITVTFRFHNPHRWYEGEQNLHLPERINRETINFSKVPTAELVLIAPALGMKITKVYQKCYSHYRYPDGTLIYA
ncbi:MAG: hypothetical protein ACYCOU_07985 [Sulfobacillus sp.]